MAGVSQLSSAAASGLYSNRRCHRYPRHNYFPVTIAPPPSAVTAPTTLKAFGYNTRRNDSDKHKPLIPVPPIIKKNLFTATLYGAGANLLFLLLQGGGGGNNNAGSIVRGGGGGGAGKSGDFWSRVFSLEGIDQEEKSEQEFYRVGSPVYMLGRLRKYTISDVLFFDRRLGAFTDPTEDPLFKLVTIRPGQICFRAHLQKELENLAGSGLFEEVDFDCKRNRDGTLRVRISFLERTWQQSAEKIRCINVGMMPKWNPIIETSGKENKDAGKAEKKNMLEYIQDGIQAEYSKRMERASTRPCLLPLAVQEEISDRLRRKKNVGEISARLLVKVRERVQQWYDDNGYACAQVVSFGKLNSEELVCEVAEGDITQIQVGEKLTNDDNDDNDNENGFSDQLAAVVERVLPHGLRRGEVFNTEAAEHAKLHIDTLGQFSNTEFDLGLDEENGGGVVVKFKLERKVEDAGGDVNNREKFFVYDD